MRRLQIAARGADLLERKRTALLAAQASVRAESAAAGHAWREAAGEVARWSARAAVLDGTGRIELLGRHVREPAAVELAWANLMGARLPELRAAVLPRASAALRARCRFGDRHARGRVPGGDTRGGASRGG